MKMWGDGDQHSQSTSAASAGALPNQCVCHLTAGVAGCAYHSRYGRTETSIIPTDVHEGCKATIKQLQRERADLVRINNDLAAALDLEKRKGGS